MGKRDRIKARLAEKEEEQDETVALEPGTRLSDDRPNKRGKWTMKQRLLVFAARGISHRDRHLMNNLRDMLPHSKNEVKVEAKDCSKEIDEICESRNCNLCLFFENKKRRDLYCWLTNVSTGPSAKFLVENVHTMEELKMTGNCLKGSRPLLSFDPRFETSVHYKLLKEMLTQVFGTPNHHPKSQPFFDHVFTFTILDHRIWFRNYQIVDEDGAVAEIGPRFTLNPIKIFEGSFAGAVLWTNEHFVSPNDHRRALKQKAQNKYKERVIAKHGREVRQPKGAAYKDMDPHAEVFDTIAPEDAATVMKNVFKRRK